MSWKASENDIKLLQNVRKDLELSIDRCIATMPSWVRNVDKLLPQTIDCATAYVPVGYTEDSRRNLQETTGNDLEVVKIRKTLSVMSINYR